MSVKSQSVVVATYCKKCGTKLEEKIGKVDHYDQETGIPYYSGSITCPNYESKGIFYRSDNGHSHISALFYNGMRCSF